MKILRPFFMAFGLLMPMLGIANDYFVKPEGTGDGTSWESAMSLEKFITDIDTYADGDNVYFWEGTYTFTSTVKITDKSLNLYGGYSDAESDITATDIDYDAHETIFKGADDKSVDCILAYNTTKIYSAPIATPVTIQGISFTGVYYDALPNTADDSKLAENAGALWFFGYFDESNPKSYNVKIKNCKFYGNESASFGGEALTSCSSNIHLIDCQFTGNKAKSRGGAIRLFCKRTNTGRTILERCLIANNEVEEIGSALLMQHGEALHIINSTITQNKISKETGGSIYVNGFENLTDNYNSRVYIVSSTIAGNSGGAQFFIRNGTRLRFANSVIVGESSKGIWGKGAVAIGSHDNGDVNYDEIISGDYNMIGLMKADPVDIKMEEIKKGNGAISTYNNYKYVFGKNKLEGKTITPDIYLIGSPLETLKENVKDWAIPADVNLDIDILGNQRDETKTRGSYAMVPVRDKRTLTLAETKPGEYYATYYIDGGFVVPEGMRGAVVTKINNSETLYLSFKYNPGNKIPAKTPVILRSKTQKTFDVGYICISSDDDTNLLRGSYEKEETTTDYTEPVYYYKMSYDPSKHPNVAFYWGAAGGAPFMNKANGAYIDIPKSTADGIAASKGIFMLFDDDEVTGIHNVSAEKPDDVIYNMNGMRVSVPAKGIYIKNGKKFIVK